MNHKSENLTQLASRFVNNTNKHIFLTGRAGTGKTTFLHEIVKTTHKNTVIAAPTGIAAINANGVTLHSLFQLPFGSFLPTNQLPSASITFQLQTPKSLLANLQMHKHKRRLLQEMELLIIDEVSMLRADLLDAIDLILKSVRRKNHLAFGGVQVLFIGDMLQLPPIVKDDEWAILRHYYAGMYFFNAKVLENNAPVYIELDTVYRQNDPEFIKILNNLRENTITPSDIDILNQYYKPQFNPLKNEGYIYLTTHNYQADKINADELEKIDDKPFSYNARVQGDFQEYNYPVEYALVLKKGAQVMFIKNDYSGEQLYFNGKIGIITDLTEHSIEVSFNDQSPATTVEPYTWENKRFTLNIDTNEIEEKVIGTFTHYPIKLAWAITVHKSQGLTFEKAIIDVSKAFAPGQAYVALSRLTSLKGLVLTGQLPKEGLEQDTLLYNFASNKTSTEKLQKNILSFSIDYLTSYILYAFDFNDLITQYRYHIETYNKEENRSVKQTHQAWSSNILQMLLAEKQIADKFLIQIQQITGNQNSEMIELISARVKAAKTYFTDKLQLTSESIKNKIGELKPVKGTKAYCTELTELEAILFKQLTYMHKAEALINSIKSNAKLSKQELKQDILYSKRLESNIVSAKRKPKDKTATKTEKKVKIDTKAETLTMYLDGKKINEIAKSRALAVITIEGHLAHFIETGILDATDFVSQEKLDWVCEIAEELTTETLSEIKEITLDDLTWSELKMCMAHYKHKSK